MPHFEMPDCSGFVGSGLMEILVVPPHRNCGLLTAALYLRREEVSLTAAYVGIPYPVASTLTIV